MYTKVIGLYVYQELISYPLALIFDLVATYIANPFEGLRSLLAYRLEAVVRDMTTAPDAQVLKLVKKVISYGPHACVSNLLEICKVQKFQIILVLEIFNILDEFILLNFIFRLDSIPKSMYPAKSFTERNYTSISYFVACSQLKRYE